MNSGFTVKAGEQKIIRQFIAGLGDTNKTQIGIISNRQGWGKLKFGKSIVDENLCLAGKNFECGLGTHADSEIVFRCNRPIKTFSSWVGVDCNNQSVHGGGEIIFSVWSNGRCIGQSHYLTVASQPEFLEIELDNAAEFTLKVNARNTIALAHADWADAQVVTGDGKSFKLGPETAFFTSAMPLSFIYNGMTSEQWFLKWGIRHTHLKGENFTAHQFICTDRTTGLECMVEMQEYKEFPACLWNVYFKNTGGSVTPILEQVKTLDLNWPAQKRKFLYRARGAFHYASEATRAEAFRDDFMLVQENLAHVSEFTMGGVEGRPSVDWMPYFNFEGENEGLVFGIGWTGQWRAQIQNSFAGIHFQAGMERIYTVLNPGESIRQPSVLMICWQGDNAIRGHNLLRHFIQENLLPRIEGKTVQAPAACPTWGGIGETRHLAQIDDLIKEKLPYDYYWIDAGWYGNCGFNPNVFQSLWGKQVGNWHINPDTYPSGFSKISDAVHAGGMKFLLWVEPERAVHGTPVAVEHPEWFLNTKDKGQSLLLNLGNPEARKWCTKLIAGLIEECGIDCYRQDFNISPLPYWQENDAPDRVGITEIRHIEGLYAFFDELRCRFPRLLIDNCASGGRRLDFEMMRRSIPLWASDMQCYPDFISERNQQQVHGLSLWLPQFSVGTEMRPDDTYNFRSAMASGIAAFRFDLASGKGSATEEYPCRWLLDRLDEYHRAKIYFSGDFYPLCDLSASFKDWSAYQFHRPDLGGGILEFFRKKDSSIERMRFKLHGLDLITAYEFEDADSGTVIAVTERELMEKGFPVEIDTERDGRLFFYRAVKKPENLS